MNLSTDDFNDIKQIISDVSPITGRLLGLNIYEVTITNNSNDVVAKLHRSTDPDGPWNIEFPS